MIPNDQDGPPQDIHANATSAFASICAEFHRTTAGIPPFRDSPPSSPSAYNAIGRAIMDRYLRAVNEIDALGVPYHHNLGVALFVELHTRACYHYYREYDRLQGLSGAAEARETRRSMRSIADLLAGARRRLPNLPLALRRYGWDAAFAGTTTFTWQALRRTLADRNISLRNASTGSPRRFPRTDVQAAILRAWVHTAHADVTSMLGLGKSQIVPFGPDPVTPLLIRLDASPTLGDSTPDILVTGTLGEFGTRLTALSAMARGVPVLTIHHGAQYMIWDEPYYELYEGSLPDFKIVYGDTELQRTSEAATSTTNVRGSDIRLYSRTDKTVARLHTGTPITPLKNLRGKSVLYLASEFESIRYGPFRDVHPTTYLTWQQQMLAWLQAQTGTPPVVRLHPKRPSTHFDPDGYPLDDADLFDSIERADVLVVDYPTTSLPIAAATSKPVVYFDLRIRQLFPAAARAIEERCMTASVDILDPTGGLKAMAARLGKVSTDTFTPTFSIAPNSTHEVSDSAAAIAHALGILTQ